MTDKFPATPDFMGINTPIRTESRSENLPVEGVLPPELQGSFFRAVPDPQFPPLFENDIALSADGMVSRFSFKDGRVDHEIRYVRTARYEAEKKAGRALFGLYRNPYTDDPSVRGVDRTVANTTPVWHAGRLYMTKEDGHAYRVDPDTLETLGSFDWGGALKSETMTAHVRIDPESGEMFFFGYEAGGLCSRDIAYCVADAQGNLVSEQWFEAPYCSMAHDFAITERYAIFPLFPTTADLDRLKAGGPHWLHEQDKESWIGVMPRYGKASELCWLKGPPGVSVYHIMNAFEDADGRVHLDMHLSDTNAFPFIRAASGIERNQWEVGGGLARWSFDPTAPDGAIDMTMLGPPGDMPRIRDADQGRPYRAGWYLSINPQGGPPLVGGPVGAAFNLLFRVEPGGRLDAMGLPPPHATHEPIHVPSHDPNHEGWLVAVIDHQVGEDDYRSQLWVIDAGNVGAGPVAKVTVPVRLHAQVHGWWVPAA